MLTEAPEQKFSLSNRFLTDLLSPCQKCTKTACPGHLYGGVSFVTGPPCACNQTLWFFLLSICVSWKSLESQRKIFPPQQENQYLIEQEKNPAGKPVSCANGNKVRGLGQGSTAPPEPQRQHQVLPQKPPADAPRGTSPSWCEAQAPGGWLLGLAARMTPPTHPACIRSWWLSRTGLKMPVYDALQGVCAPRARWEMGALPVPTGAGGPGPPGRVVQREDARASLLGTPISSWVQGWLWPHRAARWMGESGASKQTLPALEGSRGTAPVCGGSLKPFQKFLTACPSMQCQERVPEEENERGAPTNRDGTQRRSSPEPAWRATEEALPHTPSGVPGSPCSPGSISCSWLGNRQVDLQWGRWQPPPGAATMETGASGRTGPRMGTEAGSPAEARGGRPPPRPVATPPTGPQEGEEEFLTWLLFGALPALPPGSPPPSTWGRYPENDAESQLK